MVPSLSTSRSQFSPSRKTRLRHSVLVLGHLGEVAVAVCGRRRSVIAFVRVDRDWQKVLFIRDALLRNEKARPSLLALLFAKCLLKICTCGEQTAVMLLI